VHNLVRTHDRRIAAAHDQAVAAHARARQEQSLASERAMEAIMPGIARELADEAAADTRFPPGYVRTISKIPSPAERAANARAAMDRLAASRAVTARAAAVGSLPGRPAVGTHHATVPRLPGEPREEGQGAALRPTPGTHHAPVPRVAVPLAPSAAAPPSSLPPSTWGLPGADGSRPAAFFPPLAFEQMDLDIPDAPVFAGHPMPSPMTPSSSDPDGSDPGGSGPGGSHPGDPVPGRSGGPDPTFDIFAFDEYQVPVPGSSAECSVRRQVTFMVLRRSHGPYKISSSVRAATMGLITNRFPHDQNRYAQQGAIWVDELVSWAINHSRVTGEDQRLLSADKRNEPWLSQFMHLIPPALGSQLEVIGIEVAKVRAPILHAHLMQDARGYIGSAVDYITPREVRNVLVRQFTEVGHAAALERFHALRYDLGNVGIQRNDASVPARAGRRSSCCK
jgi:hypothetical protein